MTKSPTVKSKKLDFKSETTCRAKAMLLMQTAVEEAKDTKKFFNNCIEVEQSNVSELERKTTMNSSELSKDIYISLCQELMTRGPKTANESTPKTNENTEPTPTSLEPDPSEYPEEILILKEEKPTTEKQNEEEPQVIEFIEEKKEAEKDEKVKLPRRRDNTKSLLLNFDK